MRRKTDMLRTVCKIISLLMSLTLLASALCGCEAGKEPERQPSWLEQLYARGMCVENNIELICIDETDYETYNYSDYFQIDGLKDEAVEQRINERLKNCYDYMKSGEFIPPYRGIIPTIAQHADDNISNHVSMSCYTNSNGLLSICAYGSIYYESDPADAPLYVNYCVPLNFDLSDGRELTLADLFPEGTDYLSALNNEVDRQLMRDGFDSGADGGESGEEYYYFASDTFSLTAPFKGIRPEQKFLISDNGSLYLIFDYDTPEFYTGFNFYEMRINNPESGVVPVGKGEWDIFEDDTKCFSFTAGYYDALTEKTFDESDDGEHINLQYRMTTYDGVPQEVNAECERIWNTLDDMPLSLDIACDRSKDMYGDDWYVRCYKYTCVNSANYGGYTNVDCEMQIYNDELQEMCIRSFCYDSESGKMITSPEELFREPEKMHDILENAIVSHILSLGEFAGADESLLRETVSELLENINGVSVCSNYLGLTYSLEEDYFIDTVAEELGMADNAYSLKNNCKFVDYKDIGCENLVIFD